MRFRVKAQLSPDFNCVSYNKCSRQIRHCGNFFSPNNKEKPLTNTFVVTAVVVGEVRAPEPGDPGDPGEPGFNEADEGGLDRLVLVEPEKESLKLGFCLPDKLDFPSTSLSSVSFTGGRD